jgi:hypothetical protein
MAEVQVSIEMKEIKKAKEEKCKITVGDGLGPLVKPAAGVVRVRDPRVDLPIRSGVDHRLNGHPLKCIYQMQNEMILCRD